ncbi:NAD(P)/FAD-dependent oxidoreductase [bacterium]|nr:NAD(P)/FAD-dependent oxidoreductase [bacterium]
MKDVIIIGGGPAGASAAIHLCRSGKDILVIEQERVGGLLHHAHLVENFPGFAGGISGRDLAGHFNTHLKSLDIRIKRARVSGLIDNGDSISVQADEETLSARHIIIATGTRPKKFCEIDLPGATEKLIFNDPFTVDTMNGRIAIIGGGDAAFDYAIRLSASHSVTICMRSRPCCLPLLLRRAADISNISIIDDFSLKSIETTASGLRLIGENTTVECAGVLVAIGRKPALEFTGDRTGYWEEHAHCHFAGDVINGHYRQAVIAAGDGLRVAMKICEKLEEVT